jgi:hypothetical protein
MVGHPCMQRVQLGFTCPTAPPSSDNHPNPLGFPPLSAGPHAASTSHTTSPPNTIDRAYAGECALPPRRKKTQDQHARGAAHPPSQRTCAARHTFTRTTVTCSTACCVQAEGRHL